MVEKIGEHGFPGRIQVASGELSMIALRMEYSTIKVGSGLRQCHLLMPGADRVNPDREFLSATISACCFRDCPGGRALPSWPSPNVDAANWIG
ncbi:hypothetical protein [Amycolatopsis benzoatilytica]|uniref:hypothetical protein n=1 Tax=Amycolatopsis benzoatilytica TaxID=346045 RepID=UPI0012B6938D|nr:hypothetical protein [Amycolatopsis benzoatilytica]